MSHCGWSFVVENMKSGVPILAMPMHLDQLVNAKLVESFGVGIKIKKDGSGKLEREEITKVIEDLVVQRTREDVRRKTKELSENIIKKGEQKITTVAEKLVQICVNKNHYSLVSDIAN